MHIKLKRYFLFIMLLMTLLLFACSDSKNIQELRNYLSQLKEMAQNHQKKMNPPILFFPVGITYQANVLRSPFADPGSYLNGKDRLINPLQAFSLNMLKFTGTLTAGTDITAFILAPDDKIYPVKIGDFIGDHNGKVIAIERNQLQVMEESNEDDTHITQHLITLQIKEQR